MTTPDKIIEEVLRLEGHMQCACDLDNWEPEPIYGHSWVCPIYKEAKRLAENPDAERPKMWFATHRFAEILGRGAWVELYRGMSKARALAACEEKANRRQTSAKAR